MQYRICYRRWPNGPVEMQDSKNLPSLMGTLAHLAEDYSEIWVRDLTGGAIILVYDRAGRLSRP
jgi:hypothetical protein